MVYRFYRGPKCLHFQHLKVQDVKKKTFGLLNPLTFAHHAEQTIYILSYIAKYRYRNK